MKKSLLTFLACCCIAFSSNGQQKQPAPSTTVVLKQGFSNVAIELSYSRQEMEGRKIFGGLVPFGTVWRTDDNPATQITFSENVFVLGMPVSEESNFLNLKPYGAIEQVKFAVPKGTYTVYMVPGEKVWKVFLNRNTGILSTSGLDTGNKVAAILVVPQKTASTTGSLTMAIDKVTNTRCKVSLSWENTTLNIPVEADTNKEITD